MSTIHIPILRDPIVKILTEPLLALAPDAESAWIVDCTLGGGGHTAAFLDALEKHPSLRKHRVLAVDQDGDAVRRAQIRFEKEISEGRLKIHHGRFGHLTSEMPEFKEMNVMGLLADLGFSSDQLEDASRGLSFQTEGPLDMRLDPASGESVYELLKRISEKELADLIFEFGEERFSRKIAASIVRARAEDNLPNSTRKIAELIARSQPSGKSKIHPATRTFQALRIAVNGELEELDSLLSDVILSVRPGGRVAIISFHSLEDRRVKQRLKGMPGKPDADFETLTKKPIEADEEELRMNPRSRSAKLRTAERRLARLAPDSYQDRYKGGGGY